MKKSAYRHLLCLFVLLLPCPLWAQESSRIAPQSIPLGGIGAGTFSLRPDGTFGEMRLAQPAIKPLPPPKGSFSALWIRRTDHQQSQVLALQNGYALPTVPRLDFQSQYPQAFLEYGGFTVPLQVRCRAFTPLVPHDLKNSSYPAAAFIYEIRNRSNTTLDVSIAFSWESILGVSEQKADRTGSRVNTLPAEAGTFGVKFLGPPITPGNTPLERLQDNTTGDMALMVQPRREIKVTTASWNALEKTPAWWEGFTKTGEVGGEVGKGREGSLHPAGVVAVRLSLKPNDFAEVPFVVAWSLPRQYTLSGTDYGTMPSRLFPDSQKTAQSLLADWRVLLSLTEEWQRRIIASNLPRWLVQTLLHQHHLLTSHTLHGREGEFAALLAVGNTPHAEFASPEASLALGGVLATHYPSLHLALLNRLARTQSADGTFRAFTGNANYGYTLETPPITLPNSPTIETLVASTSAYVLLVAQYCLLTEDLTPLAAHFPNVKRALLALMQEGVSQSDGLPLALQRNPVRDRANRAPLLYAMALKAGERLGTLTGDNAFAKQCAATYQQLLSPLIELAKQGTEGDFGLWVGETLGLVEENSLASSPPPTIVTPAQALRQIERGKPELGVAQLFQSLQKEETPERSTLWSALSWYSITALAGFAYHSESRHLHLTPHIPGTWRTLSIPIFMPRYWGRMEFKPRVSGYLLNFRIDRFLPPERSSKQLRPQGVLQVNAVRIPRVAGREPQTTTLNARLGSNSIGIKKIEREGEDWHITFQSPIEMAVGDRLEFDVR
jgi:hypothetical protein